MKENAAQPTADLLQQVQQNDERALAALMKLFYNDLYNYAIKFTNNQASIETNGTTVLEAVTQLTETYPELKEHLFDENENICVK